MSLAEYGVMQRPDCVWRCLECATATHERTVDEINEWRNTVIRDIEMKFEKKENEMAKHNAKLEADLKQNKEHFANCLDLKLKEIETKL